MLKIIKKHWRKSKNFHSGFTATLLVTVFIGLFFAQLLNQTELPRWNLAPSRLIVLSIILFLALIWAYRRGMKEDLKDRQNYYDNYFISVMISIIATFIILYNPILKTPLSWLIVLMVILFVYFPLNSIYIKLRPKK